jgi:hypothetical protein
MAEKHRTDDEWLEAFQAGEWIPHSVIKGNDPLRKRMAESPAVWSVARDAYRIKSAFPVQ